MTIPLNSNGHRRRELRKRVLAEESICALCGDPVDKTLTGTPGTHYKNCATPNCHGCIPHPMRAEVDEIIPRAKGGSPYERSNTTMMHRKCNQFKSTKSLEQARAEWQGQKAKQVERTPVSASPIW